MVGSQPRLPHFRPGATSPIARREVVCGGLFHPHRFNRVHRARQYPIPVVPITPSTKAHSDITIEQQLAEIVETGRRRRRRHSAPFKAEAVGGCQQAGVSIAGVARITAAWEAVRYFQRRVIMWSGSSANRRDLERVFEDNSGQRIDGRNVTVGL
jgi:hypothetical protein